MSVTVPAILLQSPFWRTRRIETLSAFANGEPIKGNMLDVVAEEAEWLAAKTKGYAEQAPGEREDAVRHRRELAIAAAKLHSQIQNVVAAQRRANKEMEKARKAASEQAAKAQRMAEEAREKRERAERQRSQGNRNTGRAGEDELTRKWTELEERARQIKQDRLLAGNRAEGKKRDLSWLDDPESAAGLTRVSKAANKTISSSDISDRMRGEKERVERERRERYAKERAETDRQHRRWDEMVKGMAKEKRISTTKVPSATTARTTTVAGSSVMRDKAVLKPTKTTPVVGKAIRPRAASAASSFTSESSSSDSEPKFTAPKSMAELPWLMTPAPSSQVEAGPSTFAGSRLSDRPRPYNPFMDPSPLTGTLPPGRATSTSAQSNPLANPLPAAGPGAPASTPIQTAADLKDAMEQAEETFTEHIERLQESAVALAIEHDDMRRQIVRVEAKRKASRKERDRKAGALGLSVGKLEGRIGGLEFKDYYCADEWEWTHKNALLTVKREKIKDRTELNIREAVIIEFQIGSLERKSNTQDERTKAYSSVAAQYAQRTDALEAGLKDIMATLEKRGMALPQMETAKRQRTA